MYATRLALGVLVFLCSGVPAGTAASPVPAFPGAEGAGMYAVGGRAGRVLEVTNLHDSGPGSLRAALGAAGPRTVVFRVGGTIETRSQLRIENPFITIAGQTAPGDGIGIKGTLRIAADHVVVRHLRCRALAGDAISVTRARHVVVDHCSASWGDDEVLSVTNDSNDVTVQWCIISESLDHSGHGYASLIRGRRGETITYHHNLYAHHAGRSPRPGNYISHVDDPLGLHFDFRNNVVYNWKGQSAGYNADADRKSVTRMNFVGNYYKAGPNSTGALAFRESATQSKAWFTANMMNGVMPADPWALVGFRDFSAADLEAYKQSAPIRMPVVTTDHPEAALERILAEAGASRPVRDAVDQRIVADVRNGTGKIITHPTDVGGWPALKSGRPPADADHDGMPDDWESRHGLDPRNPADAAGDVDGNGYTNLEDYLNELAAAPTPAG